MGFDSLVVFLPAVLLILSVLRPNLLTLFDVMLDHIHVISLCTLCKSIKIYIVEFM